MLDRYSLLDKTDSVVLPKLFHIEKSSDDEPKTPLLRLPKRLNQASRSFPVNMPGKIIENRLPPLSLLFDRMR
ncbi:MAG: hypothetical protein JWR21_2665 [Herminiimonas sp.]|nr:hypothetical protein [Herminiimonas sp.]